MSTSYLNLVNKVLRRTNEVELTVDNFNSVRGIQAAAKDAVLDTVQRINKEYYQWPFDAAQHTQLLVPGQSEYSWPLNFRTADWESFQINKDDTFNIYNRKLSHITREQWYSYARDRDDDDMPTGRGEPNWVFETHGLGFGISPNPDKAYEITFRYFKHPVIPILSTDITNIPENYEYIITDGAMFHMKLFKEDAEGAQLYDQKFKEGIAKMKSVYGRNWNSMTDTRLPKYSRGFW